MTSETPVRDTAETSAVVVASATAAAAHAAAAAGVRVEELHALAELSAAADIYQTVWQTESRAAPVSPDLMRALSHAGGYVAGAFDGDVLVAASLAFHTGGAEAGLHSHISAVHPGVQGRHVGRALKLHQRAWALQHGIRTVSWTYDPLIRRNAWFNISKLGARAVGYLVNFYGAMEDAQNAGDDSDRAVALWSLGAEHVVRAAAGVPDGWDIDQLIRDGAYMALCSRNGEPIAEVVPDGTPRVLVQIPDDIQSLRASDPGLARRWRETSRRVLEPLLAGSYVASGFTRSGFYVIEEIAE